MTPDDYCANRIGGPGSSLYYSLMFVPPATRRHANALHAFVREVSDIVSECQDPGVAHIKLDWWREEILRLYADAPRHPVSQALAPVVAAHELERDMFLTLIGATEETLERVRIDSFAQLLAHCRHMGAPLHAMAATVFGYTDPGTRHYAAALGAALRLTDILADLGRDVRRQQIYLPTQDLHRFGVTETDISSGRHTPQLEALLAHETECALRCYDEALTHLSERDRVQQLPGLVLTAIARAQLEEIRRDGYRVIEHRVTLTPLRKLWIAWRTRAREQRRAA